MKVVFSVLLLFRLDLFGGCSCVVTLGKNNRFIFERELWVHDATTRHRAVLTWSHCNPQRLLFCTTKANLKRGLKWFPLTTSDWHRVTDLVHLGTDLIPFEGDGVEGGAGALPTPGPMPQAHRCSGVALRCILERFIESFLCWNTFATLLFVFVFWGLMEGFRHVLDFWGLIATVGVPSKEGALKGNTQEIQVQNLSFGRRLGDRTSCLFP